jgi:LPXTG-site transpeptidase (sortase) family protein
VKKNKLIGFFAVVGGIFVLSLLLLFVLGLVPEGWRAPSSGLNFLFEPVERSRPSVEGQIPVRIVIDKIGVDTPIQNPQSTDIAVLDNELRKGAVRYPGSGLLGQGHMFLFGHSTGLAIVRNPAYRAFSGLGNLEAGDQISIFSSDKEYIYRVFSVRLTTADEAYVDFTIDRDMVTISTCNTFGQKQDRFVVEASLVRIQ